MTKTELLQPGVAPKLGALAGIRHGFYARQGGVSRGIYASLNCGLGSYDDRDAVLENRARVSRDLGGLGDRVLTVHQCHSAVAVRAVDHFPAHDLPKADAIVTTTPGLVIGALAADCAPVLFADAEAKVVAAAHSGWRGAVGGILEATVAEMVKAGAVRSRIFAALGPAISQPAYEVGPEFEAQFLALDPGYKRFFAVYTDGGRAHFDLPGFVMHTLSRLGIGETENWTACTRPDDSLYFSYRRSKSLSQPDYGRQISAIVVA
ncbi:MAG: peptidoglycan editing factor PgeF [Pseudomonadota bacterium]